MQGEELPVGNLYVRVHPAKGQPYFEAKWRSKGKQVGRRVGPAWLDPDGNGGWKKRRGRTGAGFFDEKHAFRRMQELIAEHHEQTKSETKRPYANFDDAANEWLEHLSHGGRAKPSTLRGYRQLLAPPGKSPRRKNARKARIWNSFHGRRLSEITTAEIAKFLNDLDRSKLSPRNVNMYRQVLHSIFAHACWPETFNLPANPVSDTEKRRQSGPGAIETFTIEELNAIEQAAAEGQHREEPKYRIGEQVRAEWKRMDEQDAVLFMVAAYTGLRQGELRALKWRHIDFDGHRIIVENAVSDGQITTTKSRRVRTVPLVDEAAKRLKALSQRPHFTTRSDLVFCRADGGILNGSAIGKRFRLTQDAAGVRRRRFHDLRHTFGSRAVEVFSPVAVKDMMGHSSLTITERYLHARHRTDDAVRLAGAFLPEDS